MALIVLHKTITIPLKCVKYDSSALWSRGLPISPPFPEPLPPASGACLCPSFYRQYSLIWAWVVIFPRSLVNYVVVLDYASVIRLPKYGKSKLWMDGMEWNGRVEREDTHIWTVFPPKFWALNRVMTNEIFLVEEWKMKLQKTCARNVSSNC